MSKGPTDTPDVAGDTARSSYETLGGYRLERRLGVGGVGEVWLGRHLQTDGLAAVKRIRDDAQGEVVRRFFHREGRVIARLSHPHIVPFFDCGTDYLVTAYIDGPTLARYMNTPIEPAVAVRIFLQIASALRHVHAQGIVHRDIKPANVLLDSQGNAYLTDFGIAVTEAEARAARSHDSSGTPAYMAPEQTRGERVGAAADQYALARTLMVMLAGTNIPLQSEPALAMLPGDLPEELIYDLRRATATYPVDRWPSVLAFGRKVAAVDLQGWCAPATLAQQIRPQGPFAWTGGAQQQRAVAGDLMQADYRLSELMREGLIDESASAALLEEFGYADLGWSVLGSASRLGSIWEPAALARASEVMVLMHGWGCTRKVWKNIAPALCRDNAKAVVLTLDHGGVGDSPVRRTEKSVDQLAPEPLARLLLAWLELLGLQEVPAVLVGHSMAAIALLSQPDSFFGAHRARVALTPLFPELDVKYNARLRFLRRLIFLGTALKPIFRTMSNFVARHAPETTDLAEEVRQQMVADILGMPLWLHSVFFENFLSAKYPNARELRRCLLVLGANDPMATDDVVRRAVDHLALSPVQLRRMASGGHYPHLESAAHPEWTARNTHEIVRIIDEMLATARAGTVVDSNVDGTATVAEHPSRSRNRATNP